VEAATLIARTLKGEIRPAQRAAFPPFGMNIERQGTTEWPCLPLYELANGQLDQPGVVSNSVVLGFPYGDVEEMGSAAIVVTDNDPELAQRLADEMAAYMVAHRDEFIGEYTSVEETTSAGAQRPTAP
jgi:microcystin degradation protein MlrC